MEGVTVPLALQDYMTVIFSALGLAILTRMVYQFNRELGRMALAGMALIVLGGFLKASGKLVSAAGGPDLALLHQGLFPLIAPGFALMAWSLYQIRRMFRDQPPLRRPWLVPAILIAVFGLGALALAMAGGPWKVPLILLAAIGNVGMLILLAIAAWGRKMWFTGALFIVVLVVVLVMSQLANMKDVSIGMIWFEQITQTIAQMLFALAAWNFSQKVAALYARPLAAQTV
ncbi:MAG: hypothetical protein RMK84_07950 [Oscillochloridaceae bacterium]|nr:hypothetical protein [Chloroflexaceae bacterium]MDW8390044.1 hypothetical protein [Oscillochloridaceae bacterium]